MAFKALVKEAHQQNVDVTDFVARRTDYFAKSLQKAGQQQHSLRQDRVNLSRAGQQQHSLQQERVYLSRAVMNRHGTAATAGDTGEGSPRYGPPGEI